MPGIRSLGRIAFCLGWSFVAASCGDTSRNGSVGTGGAGSDAMSNAGAEGGAGSDGNLAESGASGSGIDAAGARDGGTGLCAVCDLYCPYGMVLGANGCPLCKCNAAPEAGADDASAVEGGAPCGFDAGPCCPITLNRLPCDPGLTCCQGVPYPANGECLAACTLR